MLKNNRFPINFSCEKALTASSCLSSLARSLSERDEQNIFSQQTTNKVNFVVDTND